MSVEALQLVPEHLRATWAKPFSELFPVLSRSVDLSYLRQVQVPDRFFPTSTDDLFTTNKLPKVLAFHLATVALGTDGNFEELRVKAEQALSVIKKHRFPVGTSIHDVLKKSMKEVVLNKDLYELSSARSHCPLQKLLRYLPRRR